MLTRFVVGNKEDLGDKRTVDREEAEAFANELSAFYYEVIAKNC